MLVWSVSFEGGASAGSSNPPGQSGHSPWGAGGFSMLRAPYHWDAAATEPAPSSSALSPPALSPTVGVGPPRSAPSVLRARTPPSSLVQATRKTVSQFLPHSDSFLMAAFSERSFLPGGMHGSKRNASLQKRLALAEEMVATSYFAFCPHTLVPAGICPPARGAPSPLSWLLSLLPCHPGITLALVLLGYTCKRPLLVAQGGRKQKRFAKQFPSWKLPSPSYGASRG